MALLSYKLSLSLPFHLKKKPKALPQLAMANPHPLRTSASMTLVCMHSILATLAFWLLECIKQAPTSESLYLIDILAL